MRYILFSGNSKVFDGALTCLLSVLMRTKTKEPVGVFLLTMDVSRIKPDYTPISDDETQFLQSVAKKYNEENFVKKIDVTDLRRVPERRGLLLPIHSPAPVRG